MKLAKTLLALFLLSFATLSAQTYPVTVSGQVTELANGNAIPNHTVYVTLDSNVVPVGYFNTVLTDVNGDYQDVIQIPNGVTNGSGMVYTFDCQNQFHSASFSWTLNNQVISGLDFQLCTGPAMGCTASFSHNSNGLTVNFTDQSTAGGPITAWAWNFGDGNTSTAQNPAHTYANAGTYPVSLLITTNGCVDSFATNVTVTNGNGLFAFAGMVLSGNPAISLENGMVWLIRHDVQQGTLTAVDSTNIDSSGFYFFGGVSAGDYLVKAALNQASPHYANYLPTYHTSSLLWSGATTLTVGPGMGGADINMIAGVNPGGPGFVGGLISQGANRMAGPGDPLSDIPVLLLNLDSTAVQYTYSDANGNYSFSNVAYGTYLVWPELLGRSTDPAIVTISPGMETVNDVNLEVNSTYVVTAIEAEVALSGSLQLYPNPVKDMLTMDLELLQDADVSLAVYSLDGKLMASQQQNMAAGSQRMVVPTSELAAGMYLVQVKAGEQLMVSKIIKD